MLIVIPLAFSSGALSISSYCFILANFFGANTETKNKKKIQWRKIKILRKDHTFGDSCRKCGFSMIDMTNCSHIDMRFVSLINFFFCWCSVESFGWYYRYNAISEYHIFVLKSKLYFLVYNLDIHIYSEKISLTTSWYSLFNSSCFAALDIAKK